MSRFATGIILFASALLLFSPARPLFAQGPDNAGLLTGTWKMTHRPVDASGKPCPFLPESIQFFKDGTLVMSNMQGMHMPYKTDVTADERQALDKRSEEFKGKSLLLVKPNPRMNWLNTPMVYMYSVTRNELSLAIQGWETATFKRVKKPLSK